MGAHLGRDRRLFESQLSQPLGERLDQGVADPAHVEAGREVPADDRVDPACLRLDLTAVRHEQRQRQGIVTRDEDRVEVGVDHPRHIEHGRGVPDVRLLRQVQPVHALAVHLLPEPRDTPLVLLQRAVGEEALVLLFGDLELHSRGRVG